MNYIGKEIDDFKVKAFQNGETIDVTKEDMLGHWSTLFKGYMTNSRMPVLKFTHVQKILNLFIKHGRMHLLKLQRSNTQC